MKFFLAVPWVVLTIVCWGMYGPVLHRGQEAMIDSAGGTSRLRPLICVGMAYFIIAVVVPAVMLQTRGEAGGWTAKGVFWSSAAGAAGAVGALGIILAFSTLIDLKIAGGPGWVMPLVFGCAPVVNAFLSIYWGKTLKDASPIFWAGLILVAVGAFTVLFTAPKPKHAPPPGKQAHATDVDQQEAARQRDASGAGADVPTG